MKKNRKQLVKNVRRALREAKRAHAQMGCTIAGYDRELAKLKV
jgi:hypothetical protein